MNYQWLNYQANYDFYAACLKHYYKSSWHTVEPTDDEVAVYCAGGEL